MCAHRPYVPTAWDDSFTSSALGGHAALRVSTSKVKLFWVVCIVGQLLHQVWLRSASPVMLGDDGVCSM